MVAASRGTVYLIAAQGVFIFLGFLLNAYLARSLSIADFGIVGVAVTLSLTITTILASGFSGAIAKFAAESPSKAASIQFYCEKNLVILSNAGAVAVLIFGYIFAGGINPKFLIFLQMNEPKAQICRQHPAALFQRIRRIYFKLL